MPPKVHLRKNPIRWYQIRLAERLGKTLKELEQSIGIGEMAEWLAYDQLETERRGSGQPG